MLVSVIMPAYNASATIKESILSVQKQGYTNWELLVINDGSSDKTSEIIQEMARQDHRIYLYSQANEGVSVARNTGMSLAKGECIAFLDSDDLWLPDFLAEAIAAKEKTGSQMTYCGYSRLYPNGLRRSYRYSYPSGQIIKDIIIGTVKIHICTLLIEKALLDKYKISMTVGCRVGEDAEFCMKVATVAKVQAIPQELMVYRIRHGSTMHSQWIWQYHNPEWYKRAANFILEHLDSTDDQELNCLIRTHFAAKLYKFLWRMVKYGYHEDVHALLQMPDVQNDLSFLEVEELKIIDKFKYKVVMSQNKLVWRGASLLRKL